MLTLAEFVHAELKRLHRGLAKTLAERTPGQLHTVPGGHPKANTIAWGLWHYARTEDNVVRWVLQDRRPSVWTEGGYAEKLGLPPAAPGRARPSCASGASASAARTCTSSRATSTTACRRAASSATRSSPKSSRRPR